MNSVRRGGFSVRLTAWVVCSTLSAFAAPAFAGGDAIEWQVAMTPIAPLPVTGAGGESSGEPAPRGQCSQVTQTYSSANFSGGQFIMQAGIVETEIAAVSYTLDPAAFPIVINLIEIIWVQQNATVPTTTAYSVLVWQGTPNLSSPIATYSSDGDILPHIQMPIGTAGVNVQFGIDPSDPEQIVVQNNGSNRFSVGFRIDAHNNPPTSSCSCGLGTLPAICCPPSTSSNAFPSTDQINGLSQPSNNWLFARNCPGATGFCGVAGGWFNFTTPGTPTGDWNIRVTYTPCDCVEPGACCFTSGACTLVQPDVCAGQGGSFQGEGTACSPNPCPQPSGACCRADGDCEGNVLQNNCQGANESFFVNETCANVSCPEPTGACCLSQSCVVTTQADCSTVFSGTYLGDFTPCASASCSGACCFSTNSCLFLTSGDCAQIGGSVFQGIGSICGASNTCPRGACCLPLGTCEADRTPMQCAAAGGDYQGNATSCGTVSCPIPVGACCLSSGGCINGLSPGDCALIPDAFWPGEGTVCPGACVVCGPADGDLNNDSQVDGRDVPAFVTALLGSPSQAQVCAGDFNGSSSLDTGDVDGFIAEVLAAP